MYVVLAQPGVVHATGDDHDTLLGIGLSGSNHNGHWLPEYVLKPTTHDLPPTNKSISIKPDAFHSVFLTINILWTEF